MYVNEDKFVGVLVFGDLEKMRATETSSGGNHGGFSVAENPSGQNSCKGTAPHRLGSPTCGLVRESS